MASNSQQSSCLSFLSTSNTDIYHDVQLKSVNFVLRSHTLTFYLNPLPSFQCYFQSVYDLKKKINVCDQCHFISTQSLILRNTAYGKQSISYLLPYRPAVAMKSYRQNIFEHKLHLFINYFTNHIIIKYTKIENLKA